ncbi:MAG: tetratricopeptide repeat protein [Actinobacteria bacterium]|nr:tetratricopeptide repeat protein [Actinomycetota bacterium]
MDVTEATFAEDVIQRSLETPVIVDFWATWCRPCRQLTPIIETAVEARDGDIVLAKVDIDANPKLAQEYRVMSVPTVIAFVKGLATDHFVGLKSAIEVDRFLDRLVPSAADRLVAEGGEDALREAIVRDPGHVDARVRLARLLLADESLDEARDTLLPVAHDHVAAGLLARLRLAGSRVPDIAAGLAAIDRGDLDGALTSLLDAVPASQGELRDDLRVVIVGVFGELGDQHPLTLKFRRRLARLLN